jgi:hypothetical protein
VGRAIDDLLTGRISGKAVLHVERSSANVARRAAR